MKIKRILKLFNVNFVHNHTNPIHIAQLKELFILRERIFKITIRINMRFIY